MRLPSPSPAQITGSIVTEIEAVVSIVRITETQGAQEGKIVDLSASLASISVSDGPPVALWIT